MSPAAAPRRIALTGVPRSGTTLCCRLLGAAGDTVALFEPMQVLKLPADDRAGALELIEEFFLDSRESLLAERRAISQQVGGVVPDNPISSRQRAGGRREREATRGEIVVDKPLSDRFTLVVKHNAAFTALLPELADRFETHAIVRNPLAVLASWHSVDLPVSRGRLPAGERLDPALAEQLATAPDLIARQLVILDWFFGRFDACLEPRRILRYEQVVASGGQELAQACRLQIPRTTMQARNASPLYDAALAQRLAGRLLEEGGAWRGFYSESEVAGLAREFSDR